MLRIRVLLLTACFLFDPPTPPKPIEPPPDTRLWTFELAPGGLMATDRMVERSLDGMELCDTLVEMGIDCVCTNNPNFPRELSCPFTWEGAELDLDDDGTVTLMARKAEHADQVVAAAKALEERLVQDLPASELWRFRFGPRGHLIAEVVVANRATFDEMVDALFERGLAPKCEDNLADPGETNCRFPYEGADMHLDYDRSILLRADDEAHNELTVKLASALEERLGPAK